MVDQPVNDLAQAAVNVIAWVIAIGVPAIIIGRVVVWAKARFEEFKAAQPENIQTMIEWAVLTAAEFVEKIELSGKLEEYARGKKDLALQRAHDLLLSVGLDIDMSVLDAALESVLFKNPDKFPSSKNQVG